MATDDNPRVKPLPFYRNASGQRYTLYPHPYPRQAEYDAMIEQEQEVLRLKRAADQHVLNGAGDPNVQAQYEAAKAELNARRQAFGLDGA
jgi:hypothetical protein